MGGYDLSPSVLSAPVWILETGRPGEQAQCQILAQALGLPFRTVPLGPNFSPPDQWPETAGLRLILSFGNAVQAACALRATCAVRPLLVHIGRPSHIPAKDLDLIIPLPQDDYPPGPNVLRVAWPFNGAFLPPQHEEAQELRHAGTIVLYGGPSRQFRMGRAETERLLVFAHALAQANQEPLHIITSPRTPPEAVQWMQHWMTRETAALHLFRPGETLFTHFLNTGNRFVVTADSASMLAEAWRTRAPVWLFPLPHKQSFMSRLQQGADWIGLRPLRSWLIRRGLLGSGSRFACWHRALIQSGVIRLAGPALTEQDLRWRPVHHQADTDLVRCQERLLALPGLLPLTATTREKS
ncbi:ELM1/GtrOC1 family putative glycosyltransferase [Acetobacter persici]|uniref:ELM1/GtrOC1 family putative glycosyltransferase n=1 Tax=Acetobacter persici TaxID=1076596 RepID=UPI001BAC3AAC|nr:ELM1/GtrOC1 family putative glycosyltransferase [Acetobacter persici]MBS1015215.1 mitochondrial fission ELM1 family protein [Acetobacter persici]